MIRRFVTSDVAEPCLVCGRDTNHRLDDQDGIALHEGCESRLNGLIDNLVVGALTAPPPDDR